MADNHTKQMRSYNMSRICNKNTKPEVTVRKFLFSQGFRYRKNVASLPGKPDIVLPKYKTVIFVNGCFWHMHNCGRFVWPSTNTDYWHNKILGNVERDKKNINQLQELGWNTIVVWEFELKKDKAEETLSLLSYLIKNNIS
ncbi:very short patch repair endonuclease [Parabacteroides goldsteinii]|uniref:very short patch repair endonuclease n=1 Tax=Parabacteroides goldsteinii TaxID=328812 RepID=UPI00259BACDD|nr:very short patch repair endonuclease [Parabacteroides goldsteinii]